MTKGIVISQQGIDISQALDAQKVIDSRFRYYDILDEVVLTLPTLDGITGTRQTIYQHNAGFLPAFDIYDTVNGDYIESGNSIGGLVSSTSEIYFYGFYTDTWSGHKVIIRVYNVPITEEYQAPIQQTLPSKGSIPSKEGIKVSRGTTDMAETELSKFAMDTASKSLAIQRTGMGIANSGTNNRLVIAHNLGHPPLFLLAKADVAGQWVGSVDPNFIDSIGSADAVNMTFRGAQAAMSGTFAYIIFKEFGDFVG